jgi:hypothetical protein
LPSPARLGIAAGAAVLVAVTGLIVLAGEETDRGRAPRGLRALDVPRDFIGVVSEDVFAGDTAYRKRNLERQAEAGVRLVRQTFDWAQIEKTPGRYDFAYYDEYVAALATRGMRLLPILFNPPVFRSRAPKRGARRGTYPPDDTRQLAAFAAALARRYGPDGRLWDERPGLPKAPIRAWQVWNEPSLPVYWASGPDPVEYAELLEETGRAIKEVDPEAEIVTAGIPESRLGTPFREFVAGMYEAGAKRSFDTLAIHPFARDARGVLGAAEGARALIRRYGDRAKVWVTELGWATGGPTSPFTVGEDGQAERIRRSLAELAARRRELGIRGVVYFNWRDARPYPGGEDFWGLHTGLFDRRGEPKPGFFAFKRAAAELRP